MFFPRFNHSSIVTYVINNRWHHIFSRRSNFVDSLQNIKFSELHARLTAQKFSYSCSTIPKRLNDEKSVLGFSSPLNRSLCVFITCSKLKFDCYFSPAKDATFIEHNPLGSGSIALELSAHNNWFVCHNSHQPYELKVYYYS